MDPFEAYERRIKELEEENDKLTTTVAALTDQNCLTENEREAVCVGRMSTQRVAFARSTPIETAHDLVRLIPVLDKLLWRSKRLRDGLDTGNSIT